MKNFELELSLIENKDDFVSFVELLISDLKQNPENWNNRTLVEYLEGISSWTEDMDGYYKNRDLPVPRNINWKVFASILVAAKMYE